jgi:hypothetical protein
MDVQTRELYHSSNGDRWYLACDSAAGVFIRHEPNRPSGGKISNIEIGTFLSPAQPKPGEAGAVEIDRNAGCGILKSIAIEH